ncbi:Chromatin modification-related protein eaf1 [Penicillium waksmanii]|uniref:Chromatin modification-related protein eaf1 n=1 Tax=Penicillium waksmanii TaxID=69791 RepID=UPI0025480D50|nr:Chromatin modification-related protein eaf1 [Penicillium waksmanii]KAJ5980390.1 Chromatin modification-related protein eaf1 [Penicillium waksmanii]
MSQQAATNAVADAMSNVQNNHQVPYDGNFQMPQQPGVPNGIPAIRAPQNKGFSLIMTVPQANQQNSVNVTNSPA